LGGAERKVSDVETIAHGLLVPTGFVARATLEKDAHVAEASDEAFEVGRQGLAGPTPRRIGKSRTYEQRTLRRLVFRASRALEGSDVPSGQGRFVCGRNISSEDRFSQGEPSGR
jgi:hypothetical protein